MADLASDLAPLDDDELLDQAEDIVRNYCGWHIAPSRTDTVTIYGANVSTPVLLPTMHLTAVSVVTDQGTLADPTVYDFETAGILRRIDGGAWTSGNGAIVVTFTHGYNTPPPAVTRVVQSLAATLSSLGNLKSKQAGPFSEVYFNELSPLDQATLSRYRIPVGP